MKRVIDTWKLGIFACVGLASWVVPIESHAADECSNPNPYMQQTCESLKQSAAETQKARDARQEKIRAGHEETVRKIIEEENAPPPAPPPKLPAWQQSLKPPAPVENSSANKNQTEQAPSEEAPPITPLPPMGPTEFAGPKPVTLPGGVTVVPVQPKKNEGTPGKIKYY